MNPDSLIGLVAVTLGCLMVLIPVTGLTARFALKPIVEAFARMRELQSGGDTSEREVHVLEQRVALLEQQYQNLETSLTRIAELKDFDRQLKAGESL